MMRDRKVLETNAKAVETRIALFRREEAKVWRDLEDVRKSVARNAQGRARAQERRYVDTSLKQRLALQRAEARQKAAQRREESAVRKVQISVQQQEERRCAAGRERLAAQALRGTVERRRAVEQHARSASCLHSREERAVAQDRVEDRRRDRASVVRASREALRLKAEKDALEAGAKVAGLEVLEAQRAERLKDLQSSLGSCGMDSTRSSLHTSKASSRSCGILDCQREARGVAEDCFQVDASPGPPGRGPVVASAKAARAPVRTRPGRHVGAR